MHTAPKILFWLFSALLAYVYVGYPLAVRLIAKARRRPVRRAPSQPTVTIIVAAFNEERGIGAKLDNLTRLDYPPQQLDVVVASDASTDATDSIVRSYPSDRVRLLRVEGRRGKTACQNAAAEAASADVLVFTDATTELDPRAVSAMVAYFADPAVGCVAGRLVYQAPSDTVTASGGTAYWSYELGLRVAESDVDSLIGVSGCLYAVRRSAYRPIPPELISDFVIALRIREQGLRAVLAIDALCYEDTHVHAGNELAMRVRVAIRSVNALVVERRLLNPLRFGLFAWQLWSHKLLRYGSPFIWIAALASNCFLLSEPLYQLALAAQLLVLGAGASGFVWRGSGRQIRLLSQPYYFLLTNLASLIAVVRYAAGERMITWKPVR